MFPQGASVSSMALYSRPFLFKEGTCGNFTLPEHPEELRSVRESCVQKSGEIVQAPAGVSPVPHRTPGSLVCSQGSPVG